MVAAEVVAAGVVAAGVVAAEVVAAEVAEMLPERFGWVLELAWR